MKANSSKSFFPLLIPILFLFFSCNNIEESTYTKIEPAQIDNIEGSVLSKLTLTEKAAQRLGILTSSVQDFVNPEVNYSTEEINNALTNQTVVPYSSVLYDTEGKTWVYTNPSPLVYIREEIKITKIEGQQAMLSKGPLAGTMVVTQGAAELLGTEYHVGH